MTAKTFLVKAKKVREMRFVALADGSTFGLQQSSEPRHKYRCADAIGFVGKWAAFRDCPVRPDFWKGSMMFNNFGDDSGEKILDDFSRFAVHAT